MAKANRRAQAELLYHSVMGEYKIPIKYRKKFMGSNKNKWVNHKKYIEFLEWKKRHKY